MLSEPCAAWLWSGGMSQEPSGRSIRARVTPQCFFPFPHPASKRAGLDSEAEEHLTEDVGGGAGDAGYSAGGELDSRPEAPAGGRGGPGSAHVGHRLWQSAPYTHRPHRQGAERLPATTYLLVAFALFKHHMDCPSPMCSAHHPCVVSLHTPPHPIGDAVVAMAHQLEMLFLLLWLQQSACSTFKLMQCCCQCCPVAAVTFLGRDPSGLLCTEGCRLANGRTSARRI